MPGFMAWLLLIWGRAFWAPWLLGKPALELFQLALR